MLFYSNGKLILQHDFVFNEFYVILFLSKSIKIVHFELLYCYNVVFIYKEFLSVFWVAYWSEWKGECYNSLSKSSNNSLPLEYLSRIALFFLESSIPIFVSSFGSLYFRTSNNLGSMKLFKLLFWFFASCSIWVEGLEFNLKGSISFYYHL